MQYTKNQAALLPPMGWNSYDYYDTTVNEEDVRRNADYLADHMKEYGWEYVVVDIQWYAHNAGSMRDRYQYIPDNYMEYLKNRPYALTLFTCSGFNWDTGVWEQRVVVLADLAQIDIGYNQPEITVPVSK